jgi:carboxypeptidase Q
MRKTTLWYRFQPAILMADAMRTLAFSLIFVATVFGQEKVDLYAVHQIKQEALDNSKVMDHLFWLTDVNGHRLTNSPGYDKAAEWVKKQMGEFGVKDVQFEKWGPFGKGWTYKHFSAHLVEPSYSPLIGYPNAWTGSTKGNVTGEVVSATLRTEADLAKWKGKLAGKIVISEPERAIGLHTLARGRRYSDADLAAEAMAPNPPPVGVFGLPTSSRNAAAGPDGQPMSIAQIREFRKKVNQFLIDEGVLAVLMPGYRGDGGTVFAGNGGGREEKDPVPPPMASLTIEHYNRIARLVAKKVPVKVMLDAQTEIFDKEMGSYNVVAEIPGGKKKEEVVMVGAHLDSWHGATGATDNAAGCAVAIEAMRILKTLNLKLDRTVRMVLWSGEEQGLLGSAAYAKEHFGDRTTMKLKPEHAKLQAYFNLDNGGGKIRGVYLQSNDMMRPVFEAWLAPFKDYGAGTLTIRNTGSTDHVSFNSLGLPGFQFIQDPLEYAATTHHSNMDVYDYVPKADMMQASAIMAAFLYHAANREEMLPRKPLPKPQPERRGPGGEGRNASPSGN